MMISKTNSSSTGQSMCRFPADFFLLGDNLERIIPGVSK